MKSQGDKVSHHQPYLRLDLEQPGLVPQLLSRVSRTFIHPSSPPVTNRSFEEAKPAWRCDMSLQRGWTTGMAHVSALLIYVECWWVRARITPTMKAKGEATLAILNSIPQTRFDQAHQPCEAQSDENITF